MEDHVVKAAKKEVYDKELKLVCNFYGQDYNWDQLKMQLAIMANSLPQNDPTGHYFHSIFEVYISVDYQTLRKRWRLKSALLY